MSTSQRYVGCQYLRSIGKEHLDGVPEKKSLTDPITLCNGEFDSSTMELMDSMDALRERDLNGF